jgi:hypothetical protein
MLMKRRTGVRRGSRKGFTLLEICGCRFVGSAGVFRDSRLIGQGRKAKQDMVRAAIGPNGSLSQALDMFKFNTGVYPEELKYLMENPATTTLPRNGTPILEGRGGPHRSLGP